MKRRGFLGSLFALPVAIVTARKIEAVIEAAPVTEPIFSLSGFVAAGDDVDIETAHITVMTAMSTISFCKPRRLNKRAGYKT